MELELKNLYDDFRDGDTIKAYAKMIGEDAKKLKKPINIMEVCGGHTHTIMKFRNFYLIISSLYMVQVVLYVSCQKRESTTRMYLVCKKMSS
jgi:hydrogenase expression/formation protein HypD